MNFPDDAQQLPLASSFAVKYGNTLYTVVGQKYSTGKSGRPGEPVVFFFEFYVIINGVNACYFYAQLNLSSKKLDFRLSIRFCVANTLFWRVSRR